jgi:ankyrin repeat protein
LISPSYSFFFSPVIEETMPMLNPAFAQAGWCPDPSVIYYCYEGSSGAVAASGFTLLMAVVLSGRDAVKGQLLRQVELDALLAAPESSAACQAVNSIGVTALMLAACHARHDSTEATVMQLLAHSSATIVARIQAKGGRTALAIAARRAGSTSTDATVAQLLAHESSSDVTRMRIDDGWTVLMVAAYSARVSSSDATVAHLLAHESASEVARMQNDDGWTALMLAAGHSTVCSTETTVAQLLAHESSFDVACMQVKGGRTALMLAVSRATTTSSDSTVAQLLTHKSATIAVHIQQRSNGWTALTWAAREGHIQLVNMLCAYAHPNDIERDLCLFPASFCQYIRRLHESTRERAVLSDALRQGLSLVEATTLLYL